MGIPSTELVHVPPKEFRNEKLAATNSLMIKTKIWFDQTS